jgi:hypothetical protein
MAASNEEELVARYYRLEEPLPFGERDRVMFEYRYGLRDGRAWTFAIRPMSDLRLRQSL